VARRPRGRLVIAARIHPGATIHVWDHLVITLRDGDRETAFLSWYAIAWSGSLGAGNVALVEVQDGPSSLAMTVSDTDGLGDRMQRRLRAMGFERRALVDAPVHATFERRPFGRDGFGVRISMQDRAIEAAWRDPTSPIWVLGEGGSFSPDEDIWAAFVESSAASLLIDGVPVSGAPFVDDQWVPKLGRALSSAHAAFSEVRVTPVGRR
jgi:hypothetical protein